MRGKWVVRGTTVAVLCATLLTAGCLYVPGSSTGEPGVGKTRLGVGLTGGWTLPFDKDLNSSSYWAGQVSYWFTGLVAAKVWFGGMSLEDTASASPGTLKVVPVGASAILSLPPTEAAKDGPFRWAIGFGGGVLTFNHTAVSDPNALPVLMLHGGGEWILVQGVGRLFAMADIAMGDVVDVAGEERDLNTMITLRGGLEISF